jgi:hypothetical protein
MENKIALAETLRSEIFQLRNRIESDEDSLARELEFPKLLIEIEKTLAPEMLNKEKLEGYAYAIFRLVTESYSFEKSILGQELLEARTKIRNFAHELPSVKK